MTKLLSVSLFGLFLLVTIVECNFYRYDYEYVSETGGWMKYHRVPDTFPSALLRCIAEGAILASPTHSSMLEAMLALNKANGESCGIFTGIHAIFSKGDYSTVDGFPLDKIKVAWAPGEPDNSMENEQCTAMLQNGTLTTVQCNETFPYICFREKTNDHPLESCGTADKLYSLDNRTRSCYKFHHIGLTWRQAYMTCMTEGGYLAIINDAIEAEVIKEIFAKNPANTIVSEIKDIATLGFLDMGDRNWVTIHGQSLSEVYSTWAENQPDMDSQTCGGVFRSGFLDNVGCERSGGTMPFICERHPDSLKLQSKEIFTHISIREKTNDHLLESCGTVDKLYSLDNRTRSCYKFHRVGLTWRQAYMTCMAEGGYLAIINDAMEAEIIKEIFAKNPTSTIVSEPLKDVASVGFYDMGDRNWVTIHGQSLSEVYSIFDKNQPDQDAQKCGAVFRNGLLDNIGCTGGTMPFICEKHPDSLKHAGT